MHDGLTYYERGKSLNAVNAESNGILNASQISRKRGVSVKAIRKFLRPCEWHHTSAAANETRYYDCGKITDDNLTQMRDFDKEINKLRQKCSELTFLLSKVIVPRTMSKWKAGSRYPIIYTVETTIPALGITIKPGNIMATITYLNREVEVIKTTGKHFYAYGIDGQDLLAKLSEIRQGIENDNYSDR